VARRHRFSGFGHRTRCRRGYRKWAGGAVILDTLASLRNEKMHFVDGARCLTPGWSGRVRDKVPSSKAGVRAAQLNR
jgi:hypothetical protein